MAQLKDLIVNGNARIITDLNVNGYETVDETVKVGRDPTANLEVATKQYVDNNGIYWITYGTTTLGEIKAALDKGSIVLYQNSTSSQIYHLTYFSYNSSDDYGTAYLDCITSPGSSSPYGSSSRVEISQLSSSPTYTTTTWTPELQGNKVTTISSSSTNDQYPSALTVYNAIAGAPDIYWCAYGVTTGMQINNAINAGKLPVVYYNEYFYVCCNSDLDTSAHEDIVFSCVNTITAIKPVIKSLYIYCEDTSAAWHANNDFTVGNVDSTDISTKIYLIGASSQASNVATYSDNQVYATNGQLDANKVRIAETGTIQYNSTDQAIEFVFA